jgi:ribonuclease-3
MNEHNQRLEFLGDAVLTLVMTCELYRKFTNASEGPLTKARAELVNRRTLSMQGRKLGLGELLILGRGEEKNGGRQRESNLADVFEALIGAIYLDSGYESAREVILSMFVEQLGELNELPQLFNPKGELQEVLQSRSTEPPIYKSLSETGPDHDRDFECAVYHQGNELGRGIGKTKKAAETEAAIVALKFLRHQATEKPVAE